MALITGSKTSETKKTTEPKTAIFNTASGGRGVMLTPEQQKKIQGTNIGANLGVSKTPAPTPIKPSGAGLPLTDPQINTVATKFNPSTVGPNGYMEGKQILPGMSIDPSGTMRIQDTAAQVDKLKKAESSPQIAVDNGTSREKEKKIKNEIDYKSQRGPLDLTYLTEAEKFAKKSLREGESGTNAGFDLLRRGMESAQAKETGPMSAGLARAGGYLGFTGSGEGVMLSLEKSHRAEMLDLEAKRTQALSEARQAYNDQMYDIALEKQTLATEYEKQQYEEKQAYFEKVKKAQEEETKAKDQERVNMDIYSALQKGAKTEYDVFGALKGRATPEQISEFFKSVKPKTTESDMFKPNNTQTAMLMGAGFGADDIQTLYDHLNENGYDEVLKASLTPYQRRVMDDIFTMKPEKVATSGGGGGSSGANYISLTPTNKRTLLGAGFSVNEIQQMEDDINKYGIDEVVKGIDSQEQMDAINKVFGSEMSIQTQEAEGGTNEIASPETVKSQLIDTLRKNKDTYSRDEAYQMAEDVLSKQYKGDLPDSYKNAIDDAVIEVYGRSFLEDILPGGRGNFPFTPKG